MYSICLILIYGHVVSSDRCDVWGSENLNKGWKLSCIFLEQTRNLHNVTLNHLIMHDTFKIKIGGWWWWSCKKKHTNIFFKNCCVFSFIRAANGAGMSAGSVQVANPSTDPNKHRKSIPRCACYILLVQYQQQNCNNEVISKKPGQCFWWPWPWATPHHPLQSDY